MALCPGPRTSQQLLAPITRCSAGSACGSTSAVSSSTATALPDHTVHDGGDRTAQRSGLRGVDVDGERTQAQPLAELHLPQPLGRVLRAHLDAADPVAADYRPLRCDHGTGGEAQIGGARGTAWRMAAAAGRRPSA